MDTLTLILKELSLGAMGFFTGFIFILTYMTIRDKKVGKPRVDPPTWVTSFIGLSYGALALSALLATFYAFQNNLDGPLVMSVLFFRVVGTVLGIAALFKIVQLRSWPKLTKEDTDEEDR